MSARLRMSLACLTALALARCGPELASRQPKAQAQATPPGTLRIEKKTVKRSIEQPAQNVEAYQHAPLLPRVQGYVKKVHVDVGDLVKAGQLLVELDVPDRDADSKQRQAGVNEALAMTRQAEKLLAAAEAAVSEAESARLRAKADATRTRTHHERLARAGLRGVIDPDSVSEAKYSAEASAAAVGEIEARVRSAEANRDRAVADVAVAKTKHEVSVAQRAHAEAYAAFARIVAPFDGVVTQRGVDEGNLVQPSSMTPMVTVDFVEKMRVFVQLPEIEARWIDARTGKEGPRAYVRGQILGGEKMAGRVTRSAFALDAKTRTLRAEIELANPERLLRPGSFVTATVEVERADVWALPAGAVRQGGGEVWCFANEGGVARKRRLLVGLEGGGLVEVRKIEAKDGWAEPAGEAVVANPGPALKDGDALR